MPARDPEPSTALFRNQAELELTPEAADPTGQTEATSAAKHSWLMTVSVDGARYLAIPARHAGSSQTGDGVTCLSVGVMVRTL
jgi:hypothetical protein